MNTEQIYLLKLLELSLFGNSQVSEISFTPGICKEAKEHGVSALISNLVHTDDIPLSVEQTKSKYVKIVYEQSRLVIAFREKNIPLVILKGTAAAMYYPKPFLRTMGDVDFIVPYDKFDEARAVLEFNDFIFCNDFGDDRDYEYLKNDVIFELHHHFSIDPIVDNYVQAEIMNSVIEFVNEYEFPCLPPVANGLVILDHIRHHFKTSGIGLRHLIDWMMFAHSVLDDEFWNKKFQPIAKAASLDRFAIVLTATCQKWLGMPNDYSWCKGVDDNLKDQTIEFFLANGNFGRKLERRRTNIEIASAELKSKNRFRYLQSTGEMTWKALKKYPWLRPFAWIYQSLRFAKRGFIALFQNKKFKNELSNGMLKGEYYRNLGI